MRLKCPFEITMFPLFQNVNRNFLSQVWTTSTIFLNISCWITKEKSAGNLKCVLMQPLKKSMSSISHRPHSLDGNNEEIGEEM